MDNQFKPQANNNPPLSPTPPADPTPTPEPNLAPTPPPTPGPAPAAPRSSGPNINIQPPSVSLGGGSFNVNKGSKDKKPGKQKKILIIALTVAILAVIGAAGYYFVLKDKSEPAPVTPTQQTPAAQTPAETTPAKEDDGTSDWLSLTNKDGKFTLKHPKDWVLATNPEACTPGLTLLGANAASVGKCASESFGQMAVSSNKGNTTDQVLLTKADYSDLVTVDAVVSGSKGVKQTGTYSGTSEGIGPTKGDKVVQYVVYGNDRTYIAVYNVKADYPDALSDFNLMVTKTLKFDQ